MQRELFERGIIKPEDFQDQVREQAIQSQVREGLSDPFAEEPNDVWQRRMSAVTDTLIDMLFANNFSYEQFEEIVRDTLLEQGMENEFGITFSPELAPVQMLFDQAVLLSQMPTAEQEKYAHRLEEIKVVLIRNMISDQLAYIKIAKKFFSVTNLVDIYAHKIGHGKIGGKAAGLLLASRIIQASGDSILKENIRIPKSDFLGGDVMYSFMAHNGFMHWGDLRYKQEEEIRQEYPKLREEYIRGDFPPGISSQFEALLEKHLNKPLIVRSSSLLEDSFGTAFAGKYESHWVANQGTPDENLKAFKTAIAKVYASALGPNALLYRRSKGLIDYDERLAILIQPVEGELNGDYFFPHASGVAFSRNLYRWTPEITVEDGFLRMVCGLGTRAVDRVGDDYPKIVALSHPQLRPQIRLHEIIKYSQRKIDLINLKTNQFETLPTTKVLDNFSRLSFVASSSRDGFLSPVWGRITDKKASQLVITFDELLKRTAFVSQMKRILKEIEGVYETPIDLEFTLEIKNPKGKNPKIEITLLQCRPLSFLQDKNVEIPKAPPKGDIIFATNRVLTDGHVSDIEYILFVDPVGYFNLSDKGDHHRLVSAIGKLNKVLEKKSFICIGPGRWGTTNPSLGIPIGYGDIYYSKAMVELSGEKIGGGPEPSFGTHFFQDLIESEIYPLAIHMEDQETVFNHSFFYKNPNHLIDMLPDEVELSTVLRLIRVEDFRSGVQLDLFMDSSEEQAIALLQERENP